MPRAGPCHLTFRAGRHAPCTQDGAAKGPSAALHAPQLARAGRRVQHGRCDPRLAPALEPVWSLRSRRQLGPPWRGDSGGAERFADPRVDRPEPLAPSRARSTPRPARGSSDADRLAGRRRQRQHGRRLRLGSLALGRAALDLDSRLTVNCGAGQSVLNVTRRRCRAVRIRTVRAAQLARTLLEGAAERTGPHRVAVVSADTRSAAECALFAKEAG